MTMTDAERTALHNKLTDVLGTREALKLMEHLPPIRWDQLATKDDLKASEERLGARIDGTNVRLDGTNVRLDETNARSGRHECPPPRDGHAARGVPWRVH